MMGTANRPGGFPRGGGKPKRLPIRRAVGILVGVVCDHCGKEQLASIPGAIVCLACGKKATP